MTFQELKKDKVYILEGLKECHEEHVTNQPKITALPKENESPQFCTASVKYYDKEVFHNEKMLTDYAVTNFSTYEGLTDYCWTNLTTNYLTQFMNEADRSSLRSGKMQKEIKKNYYI